jgi:hypothetical protein
MLCNIFIEFRVPLKVLVVRLKCVQMKPIEGSVILWVVSRQILIAVAQVQSKVRSYDIYSRQNVTELGFLLVCRFPVPVLIPQTAPLN